MRETTITALKRRLSGSAILCYHGIARHAPERSIHVSPGELRSAIGLARRLGTVVPLRDIVDRVRAGRSTAGLIAVTFDDAYASLIAEARDFIQREAVPVTVFVVAEAAVAGSAFWWDQLETLAGVLSAERWHELIVRLEVPAAYRTGGAEARERFDRLRAWILRDRAGRAPATMADAVVEIAAEPGPTAHDRAMTFVELERFAALPMVDVGVHTMSHPVLPLLPDAEVLREVQGCHAALRERLPGTLPVLAVPFGLVDDRVLRLAEEAGMHASLSLSDNTLSAAGGGRIPRLGMTRGDPIWKLPLRLTGMVERVRGWRTGNIDASPAVPG